MLQRGFTHSTIIRVVSIELNVEAAVPEWGNQRVRIALEEDAALVNGEMRWLHGRQEKLHLI